MVHGYPAGMGGQLGVSRRYPAGKQPTHEGIADNHPALEIEYDYTHRQLFEDGRLPFLALPLAAT